MRGRWDGTSSVPLNVPASALESGSSPCSPGNWEQIAEQALEFASERAAPGGRINVVSTPDRAVTDTSDIDPCPYCGTTADARVTTDKPPKVQAWSCAACGTYWAISVVSVSPYLDQLTAAVELAGARSVLRQVIAFADETPGLTDDQLRLRLARLATRWDRRNRVRQRRLDNVEH